MNKVYHIRESDVLLFVTSMGFDLSCYDIFGTLAAGGKSLVPLSLADCTPGAVRRRCP